MAMDLTHLFVEVGRGSWKHLQGFLSSVLLVSGDILLNVNGIDLTGVSRSEAVALLKNTNSSVVLKALEMRACEAQEEQGHLPPPEDTQVTSESSEWSPSWVMWLGLPR